MSVAGNSPINNLQNLGLSSVEQQPPRDRLDQAQFLKLMMTQLNNQDPLKPMESTEFFGQMAQFSTVAGIQDLQTSFSTLASSLQSNQALQAANLIGRSVLVPGNTGLLAPNGALSGAVDLSAAASDVQLSVYDQNGQLIRRLDLGPRANGTVRFTWDGIRDDGQFAAPGIYTIRADAAVDGHAVAPPVSIMAAVESVTLGPAGQDLLLNLTGLGSIAFSDVKQIR